MFHLLDRLLAPLKDRESASRGLVLSALWSLPLRLVGMVLAFVVGVQLARYLGPAGLGVYGIAFGIVTVLAAVAQMGLYLLATGEIALSRSAGDWGRLGGVIRWFALSVCAAGILLGLAFLLLVQGFSASPDLRAAAWWGAPLIAIMAWTLLASAELRALDRLVAGQALEILIRPALMSLLLLWLFTVQDGLRPDQALALNLAASLVTLLVALLWLHRALPHEARRAPPSRHVRRWLMAGIPLALTEILRQLEGTYGLFVIGALGTSAETGIFRVALSIMAVIGMPLTILTVITAPTLARLHVDQSRPALQKLLSLSACAVFAAVAATILLLMLAGPGAITILFGEEYAGSFLPLILLSLAQLVNGFFGVGLIFLAVTGGGRQIASSYAASVVVGIAAACLLAPRWGPEGVAIAAVIGSVANNLLAWIAVRRRDGLDTSLFGIARLIPRAGPTR